MSKASKETYVKQLNTGKPLADKERIKAYIKSNPYTHIHRMKIDLRISHQTLTARLSDLLDNGCIEVAMVSKVPRQSSLVSRFIIQENEDKKLSNRVSRLKEKKIKWLKKGLELARLSGKSIEELISA